MHPRSFQVTIRWWGRERAIWLRSTQLPASVGSSCWGYKPSCQYPETFQNRDRGSHHSSCRHLVSRCDPQLYKPCQWELPTSYQGGQGAASR